MADSLQDKLLKQGWVAVNRLSVNNYNAIEVIGLVLKLKEIEKNGMDSDKTKEVAMKALEGLLNACETSIIPAAQELQAAEPRALELVKGTPQLKFAGKA